MMKYQRPLTWALMFWICVLCVTCAHLQYRIESLERKMTADIEFAEDKLNQRITAVLNTTLALSRDR